MADDHTSALATPLVGGIAAGRVAIGVVATLAPAVGARFQFGSAPPAQVVTVRMLGARDLGLGLGALLAMRHGGGALRTWVQAGALADAVDAWAFARAGRAEARGARLTTVVAAAAAVGGAWAAGQLSANGS